MLSTDAVLALAREYLEQLSQKTGHDWVLMMERTRQEECCWVLYYSTRAFVENPDTHYPPGGNGPLIVDANTGEVHQCGTARRVEHYVSIFKRDGHLRRAHE